MSRWLHPFALSLSNHISAEGPFDKLTTNGICIPFYRKECEDRLQGGWMNRQHHSS